MGGGSAVAWDFLTGSGEKALPGLGVTVRGPQLASHPHPLPSIKQLHLVSQITFIPPPHGCKHRSRPPPPYPRSAASHQGVPIPRGLFASICPTHPKNVQIQIKALAGGRGGTPGCHGEGGQYPGAPKAAGFGGAEPPAAPSAQRQRALEGSKPQRWAGGRAALKSY